MYESIPWGMENNLFCFTRKICNVDKIQFPLFYVYVGTFMLLNSLVAGLRVGEALVCSTYLALGSSFPSSHIPGRPTSMCNLGLKQALGAYGLSLIATLHLHRKSL